MTGDCYVRICGSPRVRSPRATRPWTNTAWACAAWTHGLGVRRLDTHGLGVRRLDTHGLGVRRLDTHGLGVRRLDTHGLGVRRLDKHGLGVRRLDTHGLGVRRLDTHGLGVRRLDTHGLGVRRLDAHRWACTVWTHMVWACAVWTHMVWACAAWTHTGGLRLGRAPPGVHRLGVHRLDVHRLGGPWGGAGISRVSGEAVLLQVTAAFAVSFRRNARRARGHARGRRPCQRPHLSTAASSDSSTGEGGHRGRSPRRAAYVPDDRRRGLVCPRKTEWLLPALGDSQGPHPDEQRCRNYHVKGSSSRNRSFRRFFLGVLRDRYGSVSDTSGMRRGDTCEECQSYHATSPRPTDTGLKHPLESRRGTGSHRGSGRFLSYLGSVAGQVFVLQIILVGLLVTAAVMALALFAQKATVRDARHESLAAARAFANAPGTVAALESRNPTAVLQPRAVAAVKGTNLQWVSVLSPHGIRWAYPNPKYLGKRWPGDMSPWLNGRSRIVQAHIPPSLPSHLPGGRDYIQAEVPVLGPDGSLAGVVFAGLKVKTVNSMVAQQLPIIFGAGAGALVTSTVGTVLVSRRLRRQTRGLRPIDLARMYEHHDAVLHAVREGVLIVGADGRLLLVNDEAQRLLGLPTGAEGRDMGEVGLDGRTTGLLVSGESVTDEVHLIGDRLLAVNKRPTAPYGGQAGSVVTLRDTTELAVVSGRAEQARERLKLLYDAGVQVGTTLDVVRTAEELSQVVVPRFADVVAVDLLDVVVQGQEPVGEPWRQMRRTAVSGPLDGLPLYPVGELITFTATTPQARALETGRAQLEADLRAARGWQEQDPGRAQRALEYGLHSLITVPLQARGVVLGMVEFLAFRAPHRPFEEDDLSFAEELAMESGYLYRQCAAVHAGTCEAVTLQRSLLPRGLPEQNALEVAWRYLPAQAGVGGDWFDVIPLRGHAWHSSWAM